MSASLFKLRWFELLTLSVIALGGCSGGDHHGDGAVTVDDAQVGVLDAQVPDAARPDAADDAMLAPPINRTVPSDFASGFSFLFDGPMATQVGVAAGAIDPTRMAVVRGRVVNVAAQPLAGVRISVAAEPKLGSTLSKADGTFDLVVNGGATVRVSFAAAGYLSAERALHPSWNAFEQAPDVFLSTLDPTVSTIDLSAGSSAQVASGSKVSDRNGQRTATLVFAPGTTANMVLPGGQRQPLTEAHVRVTEYTAGDNGPKAMPATLPPQSGYTYAVELSIDEALAMGATGVEFSKPVPYYVENFLHFPLGEPVPAGYLDRSSGQWVASDSGRVLKVLAVTAGSAQIDSDGDQQPDTSAALAALGIDAGELAMLGASYPAGSELWRVPLAHFSAWDFNWCFFGRLFDSLPDVPATGPLPDSCVAQGSVIECENQILGESVPLTGAPYRLHYRSDRVPGRRDAYHLDVALTGASAPPNAKRVRFELDVLGQHITHVADAAPNQHYAFDWDGHDAFGRLWQGPAAARFRVGYVYDGWYSHTPVFGAYGEVDRTRWQTVPDNQQAAPAGVTADDDLARLETTMWLPWQSATLGTFDASALGFGGLTLGVQHAYDAASHTLYLGTGERRQATSDTTAVRAILGAVGGKSDTSGQARRTQISEPHGVAVAPDGSIYVSLEGQNRIVRVAKDGSTQLVAGAGTGSSQGDGGPATSATLDQPLGIALAHDGTLYVAERGSKLVRRVRTDGIIERFAGGGTMTDDGAPKPALEASFGEPHALAFGADGSLFIADATRHNVRRVRTDGTIEIVLGSATGQQGDTGDGGPGTKALLRSPLSVAVGPDGSVYVAEYDAHRIRRLTPDGSVMTVAGTGSAGRTGDDGPALLAQLANPHTVDVAPNGTLYVTDEGNGLLRSVTPDGVMHTVAGGGATRADDFCPALDADFALPRITVVEPNGNLIVADYDGNMLYRVAPALPAASADGSVIADQSGGSYFVFDGAGRHLQTVNAYTKQVLWSFAYDAAGRLSSVTDANARVLRVERDATSGAATRLVTADGLATTLAYDAHGWLSSVTNPAGETHQLALSDAGLLLSLTDAAQRVHSYAYDDTGRLTRDTEPSAGFQTLARSADHSTVTRENGVGQRWVYTREQVDGASRRTVTLPDGRREVTLKQRTSSTSTAADGSSIAIVQAADPRFGMQAAYAATTTMVTPAGLTSKLEQKRTVTLTNPDDPSTLSTLTESATLSGSGQVQTVFDATARTLTTSALGDSTRTTLDEQGRVAKIQPAGALDPVDFSYDAQGRLVQVTQGTRSTSRHYDEHGFLDAIVDPVGRMFSYTRDALGRPLSSTVQQVPLVSFVYAPGGDLSEVHLPSSATHRLAYDAGGRLTSYVAPAAMSGEPSASSFGYALDDMLTNLTTPSGRSLSALRDDKARLVSVTMPEGSISYRYDDVSGRLAEAVAGNEHVALTWDGPLLTASTTTGSAPATVAVTYDASLRVTSETVQGVALASTRDAGGRLSNVGTQAVSYRDARRISRLHNGSIGIDFSYSKEYGELSRQTAAASTTLYDASYVRDALGRVASMTETIAGQAQTLKYTYDVVGRLASVEDAGGVHAYSYDQDGNRSDGDTAYDARGRQTRRGAVHYAYDADGYLQQRSDGTTTRSYVYDARGQLRSVTSDGARIDYFIDPLGRRSAKQVGGTTTQSFVYDLRGRIVAELDASGALVSRFVYASRDHVPDYLIKGSATLQLVSDPRGSPRLVVDTATGTVVQRMDYDAWGNVVADTAPGTQPFGFAGGLWDADTRLVRFGVRDYDPELGRWTAPDPLLFAGGQPNLYVYANDDPVNHVDPDGRNTIVIGGELGAELGTVLLPGVGTILGGAVGIGLGIWLGDKLVDWAVNNASTDAPTPPTLPAGWDGTTPPAEGWGWRGPDAPGGPRGGWVSPDGSESLHPDFGHPEPIGPHVDWNDPNGGRWRIFPDGTCSPK